MALTLTNVFNHFTRRKRDTSDVSNSLWYDWMTSVVNEVYSTLLGCDPNQFLTTQSYSAVTGAQSLPSYFGSLNTDGCGVFTKDGSTQLDTALVQTNFGSLSRGFWIDDANINFTGIDAAETVTLRYAPKIRPFTSMADYVTLDLTQTGKPILQDEDIELLTAGADLQYAIWDEDSAMEGVAAQRFNSLLNELAGSFRQIPQAYSMSEFHDIY